MIHSYPWYIADWRGSEAVLGMNLEEKGLYREMLDHCWERGSLPIEERLLRQISGASAWEFKRSWPKVRQQFTEIDGRLHNVKVDEKRDEIEKWHEGRRESGKLGAAKRWGKKHDSSANSSPNGSAIAQVHGHPHPLPHPLPTTAANTTTQQEPAVQQTVSPQPQQQQLPPLPCASEYPRTLSACRSHDAGTDDLFVRRLVQTTIQNAISHNVTNGKLQKINDRSIAAAVDESYKTGPPGHRNGLLLNRVPAIILAWCTEDN